MATSCCPALKGEEQPWARSTEGLGRDLGTRPPATAPGCGRATSQKVPSDTPGSAKPSRLWVQPILLAPRHGASPLPIHP